MAVIGKDCFVFEQTGLTCDVSAFSPDLPITSLPIVDAVIVYDCPYKMQSYLLMIRNALYVETMPHNLIPPFLMREAGITVNDTAKIHVDSPDESHHSICFPDDNLRIPLSLHGIFSYFNHRKPILSELDNLEILFLTPDASQWDPNSNHYAENESSLMDCDGHVIDNPRSINHDLLTDEDMLISSLQKRSDLLSLPTVAAVESAIDYSIADFAFNNPDSEPESFNTADDDIHSFVSSLCSTVGSSLSPTLPESEDLFLPSAPTEIPPDTPFEVSGVKANKTSSVTPEFLSKLWCIDEKMAQGAIDHNTHLNRVAGDSNLSRHFSTNDRMLRYRRINSFFFTDTFFVPADATSSRGHTCMQIFVSDKGYVAVYPLKSKSKFKDCLHLFCKEVGVPHTLVLDMSGEQTTRAVKHFSHQVGLTLRILEESTQWANRAELYIGLLKSAVATDMRNSNCPMVLWDYCAERRALIHNLTPRDLFQNAGKTPIEATFGMQGDISNLSTFGWYDWCYYRETSNHQFPHQRWLLGRVLGPSKNEGNEMAQSVLTHLGKVVPRRTVVPLTRKQLTDPVEVRRRHNFDKVITEKLGDSHTIPTTESADADTLELADFSDVPEDDLTNDPSFWLDDDPIDANGNLIYERNVVDTLIDAEVLLPLDNTTKIGRVKRRTTDQVGNHIGVYDSNPLLNTINYDVVFSDGATQPYSANIIAQNLYSQIDEHGHHKRELDCIIGYKQSSTAVRRSDMWLSTPSGQRRMRKSTKGWTLLVKWIDGTQQWIPLKRLKEFYPVEVAEYAVSEGIDDQPAFAYWIPHVLKKRDKIISAVKQRVAKTTHKYGIELPTSVRHAHQIDARNGNTLWADALALEMNTILIAFDFRGHTPPPPGYSPSSGHIIFDVKMDFTRKARWVKDGHRTRDPDKSNFAGVVSRDSIRILLTYAALNNLNVWAADIKSAYLQAPTSEKHYIRCGPEFGPEREGTIAVITRALYGGKSAGADYWKHMRACMTNLGFTSCEGDQDVWRRRKVHPKTGAPFYEYCCLYVDDCLVISDDPERIIRHEIGKHWELKKGSVGPPSVYLGNKVSQVILENDTTCYSFSSSQYTQAAVKNVQSYLKEKNLSLPKKATSPFRGGYRPETDITPELNPSDAAHFQSLIGVLRWIVELGRVDITCEVSEMASMMALPREGHLDQLYHIFAYLKSKHNAEMVFDPTTPTIDKSCFEPEDWSHTVYNNATEKIAENAPAPLGLGFTIRAYVDADHAGNLITRRSRTGFIIFLNNAPIYWSSKKQTGIETSSFGSEFMAMKSCCEYLRGLRFKLRSFGIPVDSPCYVFGDNKSVLSNTTVPDSVLQKKSLSIAYHFVREGVSSDEWRTTYVNTDDNCADMLSKSLPGGQKRRKFTTMILHHVYDYD